MASQDEFLQIDTPENVIFGYEVAGIGSRFLAALFDHLVIIVVEIVIYVIFFIAVVATGAGSRLSAASGWIAGGLGLISFVVLWGYFIVFEAVWNGQTPGKRVMKLRVIRVDGTPITLVEALIRNLARLIDFLPITYGVGIVTMFINGQSRRLGDLAAGTLVVFERSEITLESLRAPAPPTAPASAPPAPPPIGIPGVMAGTQSPLEHPLVIPLAPGGVRDPALPVERLTERESVLLEEYLRRRREISGRATLARQVAQTISKKMGIPYEPMNLDALDTWLARVLIAYREYSE